MEEQLVSFETAKLAYQKGFDLDCRKCYDERGEVDSALDATGEEFFTDEEMNQTVENGFDRSTLAPTQELLQAWLLDKHQLYIRHGVTVAPIRFVFQTCNLGELTEINHKTAPEVYYPYATADDFYQGRELILTHALNLLADAPSQ